MARDYALEELGCLVIRPYSPRIIPGGNAIFGGRNELREEKARHSRPSKSISDTTNRVYKSCSERASYGDDELEEGEIREDEASVMPESTEIQMHCSSREVNLGDYKIAELNIREGGSSFLRENSAKSPMHKTGQRIATTTSDALEEGEIREEFDGFQGFEQPNTEEREINSTHETGKKICVRVDLLKKQIEETCSRRLEELLLRQKAELKKFKASRKQQETELLKGHYLDLDKLRDMDIDHAVRERRRKSLNHEFATLKDRLDQHMQFQYKKFVIMQIEARNREKEIKERWVERAKGGTLEESFEELPLSETGFNLEKFKCGGKYTADGGQERSPQITDSCSNFREPVTATVECQPAETFVIASVGMPQDKLREQESPRSPSICTEKVHSSETTMSHHDASELIQKELPISSLVSESSKQYTDEMDSSAGVNSNLLPEVRHLGGENTGVVSQTPVSQSNTGAASGMFEVVTASSVSAVGKKDGGTGSYSVFSEDACSQSWKELPGSSHVSESSKQNTNEMNSSRGVTSYLLPVVQHVGEENTCAVSLTPLSQSDAGAASSMFEAVATGSVGAVAVGKKDGGTGSYSVFSEGAYSQSEKELPVSSHVSESSKQKEIVDLCDEMPQSADLVSVENDYGTIPETVPEGVSSVQQEQNNHPLMEPVHPPVAAANDPPARKGSECLRPSDTRLDTINQLQSSYTASVENDYRNRPETVRISQAPSNLIGCSSQHGELRMQVPEGTSSAQQEQNNHPLVEPTHPPAATANDPPARTGPECLVPSDTQLGTINRLMSSYYTVAQTMPHEGFHSNPLHSEFVRVQKLSELITQMHQRKRAQLVVECEMEVAKARKKYNEMIHGVETEFFHTKKKIESIYDKVNKHQKLAAEFQGTFKKTTGGISNAVQGPLTMEQLIQPSQWQCRSIPSSAHISPSLPPTTNPGIQGPFPRHSQFLPGEHSGFSSSAIQRPALGVQHNAAVLLSRPTNLDPFAMHRAVGSLGVGSMVRAPAPHLCRRPLAAPNLHPAV